VKLEGECSGSVSWGIDIPAARVAALWEVSLQNLAQTRADCVSSPPPFAPRALLQIFIKTTPHHRLRFFVAFSFTRSWSL
jgi:hypothetical protein